MCSQSKKQNEELQKHNAWLVETIENQIIPRLILAHKKTKKNEKIKQNKPEKQSKTGFLETNSVERFTKFLSENDVEVCKAYVETLIEEGVSIEDIYLKLITPSARKLGYFWEEDIADFTVVTLAIWKIQQVLYQFSDKFLYEKEFIGSRSKVLLIPAPGSQHTLGLFILGEFFRKNGWHVHGEPSISEKDTLNLIKQNHFDIIGISIGANDFKEAAKKLIKKIRQTPQAKFLKIIVGGPATIDKPHFYNDVFADAQSKDANNAVIIANRLIKEIEKTKKEEKNKKA